MIRRLLIANRGEIACRIARTAHRLGIDTVGVFSEGDRGALHTRVVDRAVLLDDSGVPDRGEPSGAGAGAGAGAGGGAAGLAYLRADLVLEAARRTGADAVHPGYGFLSESAGFARAVEAAGLIWVGPTPGQIELLGDKVAAKAAAVSAGVPTTEAVVVDPGALADPLRSGEASAGLPVPAMVKAAAGGGGRGMRIVSDRGDFAEVVASASREAEAAFGDGTVFVEPLIVGGRHVEVQVLGDTHGNVVHLGERDCSIQRRHQKVIEEAPSPGIDDATREALCSGAVSLARSVGYRGAGTVEYLVGADGTISFLEVNTRLQVEHPVTEAVWGVDLVELQLLVAEGGELPFTQGDLRAEGHAMEARLVAESPGAGWIPSAGVIRAFAIDGDLAADGSSPRTPGIRVDSGVAAGSVVGTDYDSLLAKVISHASTRHACASTLARALRNADLDGVATNADTLAAICAEGSFLDGGATTDYLQEHPEVCSAAGPTGDDRLLHAIAALVAIVDANRGADEVTGFAPPGWRNVPTQGQRLTLLDSRAGATGHDDDPGAEPVPLEYRFTDGGLPRRGGPSGIRAIEVLVGPFPQPDDDGVLGEDRRRRCEVVAQPVPAEPGPSAGETTWAVQLDGMTQTVGTAVVTDAVTGDALGGTATGAVPTAAMVDGGTDVAIRVRGSAGRTRWVIAPRFSEPDSADTATGPVSPLPGSVVSVHVAPGDTVSDGDLLVVIEAMKMEHRITARAEVTIDEVRVAVGEKVDAGQVLVTFAGTR